MQQYAFGMQQSAASLREFMEERSLTQEELAKAAEVSQAAVSRALKKPAQRAGRAHQKIFTYVENEYAAMTRDGGPEGVVSAFKQIWDGSPAHAAAVVRIINALDGLRPQKTQEK
jgi:Helix-turn-helix